ncbi:MAG: S9 family peptidase [Bacteroidota bacterium]|nr:S9 family peptidase [Bacteroidota bacterium]
MKKLFYSILLGGLVLLGGCKSKGHQNACADGDFSNALTEKEIAGKKLTPEILWKFGRVADAHLSPDGKTVIYNISRYDVKTNKKHTWIYSVSTSGGDARNLTSEMPSCENPRWISGEKIAFLTAKDSTTQIWIMNADGSGKAQISSVKGDVNGFEFSANGSKLFYLQDVKTDSTTQDKYPDLPLAKGRIATDLMYRHWDHWSNYTHSHIFVADYKDGKVATGIDILKDQPFDSPLPPYYDIAEISWSADGKLLAYSCKKLKGKDFALSTNSDIYIYHVDNGTTENISEGMMGYDRNPVFSPDGKKVAFQSMETPGYESDKSRLFVYDFATKTRKYLTENFDQDATNINWSADGKTIYFISGIKATYQVYAVTVENSQIRQLTTGVHDYTSLAFENNVLVGTQMSMSMSPEIFRIDPVNGTQTQLTFTNKNIYDNIKMGKVEERWVKTTDGKQMLVWLIFPPDFDPSKKYPALLYCQGGPQDAVSQFFSFRWNFQMMAAKGYVVIAPNRRGLPTFGSEWNKQISGDYGGQNIQDYLSATDALKTEPFIDANRLGAVGASYGGFSVYYLAGCHQKRFKAFIAHCGMFNLESEAASTEEFFFTRHDLGGFSWENPKPKSYSKFSPHLYADKWDTPIMIITGANDFRIPYTESLQAFNVAQLRGIPSKLLFFPDESHWVTKPQNSILWQREFFEWLDKWLK